MSSLTAFFSLSKKLFSSVAVLHCHVVNCERFFFLSIKEKCTKEASREALLGRDSNLLFTVYFNFIFYSSLQGAFAQIKCAPQAKLQ